MYRYLKLGKKPEGGSKAIKEKAPQVDEGQEDEFQRLPDELQHDDDGEGDIVDDGPDGFEDPYRDIPAQAEELQELRLSRLVSTYRSTSSPPDKIEMPQIDGRYRA